MKIIEAHTWLRRASGLLGLPKLVPGEVLWLRPCHSIHTFGMRYCIAVFFLDRDMQIIDVRPCVRPNRIVYCHRAHSACEMLSIKDDHCSSFSAELSVALLLKTAV